MQQDAAMATADHGAVLFDLDGVLIDSRAAITECINAALVKNGLERRAPGSLLRFIGPPLGVAFAEMTGCSPASRRVASCVAAYRSLYTTVSLRETVIVADIAAAVEQLRQRWPLAIATSKPVAFAGPLLDKLELRDGFACVCGPDLRVQGEDKATTINRALKGLGMPGLAVMVGDRSFDVVGAHANGLPAIGVTWGIGDRSELQSAGADAVIDTPAQLPTAVARLMTA
jgi:phosphoglycolate phosphatase